MANRSPNSQRQPRQASRRFQEPTLDILHLLNSKMGCDQLQVEIMKFIRKNKWFAIEQALEALEEDVLLICVFSTIYTAKADGKGKN